MSLHAQLRKFAQTAVDLHGHVQSVLRQQARDDLGVPVLDEEEERRAVYLTLAAAILLAAVVMATKVDDE